RAAGRTDEAADLLFAQLAHDARLFRRRGLVVLLDAHDGAPEDAAGCVDLVDGNQPADIERCKGGREAAGRRPDPAELEGLLLCESRIPEAEGGAGLGGKT